MSKIATKFGVTIAQLLAANPQIKNPDKIKDRGRDHDPGAAAVRGARGRRRVCLALIAARRADAP